MADKEQGNASAYGKVIARAWRDPSFKAKLLADPQSMLEQAGVIIPAGVSVRIVENTDTHVYFVLPPKPAGLLSDEALDQAAGGGHPFSGPNQTVGNTKATRLPPVPDGE